MRIDTDLDEQHREAIKHYAEENGYTMKGAYTKLLRDALWMRSEVGYFPDRDNVGVAHRSYDSGIRTNIDREDFINRIDGGMRTIYMPLRFALEAAGIDVEDEIAPSIFENETTTPDPVSDPETLSEEDA